MFQKIMDLESTNINLERVMDLCQIVMELFEEGKEVTGYGAQYASVLYAADKMVREAHQAIGEALEYARSVSNVLEKGA